MIMRFTALGAAVVFVAFGAAPAAAQMIGSYHAGCLQGGGAVTVQHCNAANGAQHFAFTGYGPIKQGNSCLTSVGEGRALTMQACGNNPNQRWAFKGRQLNNEGGWCADVKGQGRHAGAEVIAWKCHGQSNQQWARVGVKPATSVPGISQQAVNAIKTAPAGSVVDIKTGRIVAAGGGNLIGDGGGTLISKGGAGIVAAGGGNIVAAGGGN